MVRLPGRGTFAAFRYKNFQYFTWGQIISQAGTRIHEVAAGWLMWQLTGSAAWVGAIAVAEITPRLLLWPLSGALADRIDRRRLAMISQSLAGGTAIGLTVLSALGAVNVVVLLVFTALFGMNAAFWQPVRFAVIPHLVPREALASAVALSSVISNVARVVGPVMAGPAIVWGSVTFAFAINALSFVGVVIAFWLMRLPPAVPIARPNFSLGELSLGISIVFRNKGVRSLLLLVGIFALCVRPAGELLPVFAEALLQAGPGGLATLISAMGAGSLLSGLVASRQQEQYKLIRTLGLAGVAAAIMTAALVCTSDLRVAAVVIAVMGFGVTMTNIISQILLQLTLADEIRGRVLSIYGVLFACLPGVGALVIGWAADRVGITLPFFLAATIGFCSSLAVFLNRRRLAAMLTPPADGNP